MGKGTEKRWVVTVLLGLLGVVILGLAVPCVIDPGRVDAFYLRFTTKRQSSLVLGTSRAAQGIVPEAFNRNADLEFEGPLFNYAFTNNSSRPGPGYYQSVRKKLDENASNGLFILEVSPRALSHEGPEREETFIENKNFVATLEEVARNPNYEYLHHHYGDRYLTLLLDQFREKRELVHPNGWLEIRINKRHGTDLKRRIQKKTKTAKKRLLTAHLSQLRLQYFVNMVRELSSHGRVFVVRLPTSPTMRALEHELFPEFDDVLTEALDDTGAHYLNFIASSESYTTNDGAHLHRDSSRRFSKVLAKSIAKLM